jgi:hypothetical protein
MVRIVVDNEMLSRLGHLHAPAELHDESGRLLAYLTPVVDSSVYATADPGISEEELDAREAEEGGRSLAEIWADLEKRA